MSIGLEGVKLLEQRFTRIGKEKAQSGHAYKEMTEHVITTGTFQFYLCYLWIFVDVVIACIRLWWDVQECQGERPSPWCS